jgi:CheY-like chemotaxis protein
MLLKNKRIFIFEDNPANKAILTVLLEKHGAKTAFDRWGMHAIERAQDFVPIDLFIVDLMFPNNVTGYDIFKELHRFSEFAKVPVVAVSATDASVAVPKVRELGFAGFIAKPIDMDAFPMQIAKLLEEQQVWEY